MPLTERAFLSLKTVGQEGSVDLLHLKDPGGGDQAILAIPIRVNKKGIILALPSGALSEEDLAKGADAEADELIGPSQEVQTVCESEPSVEIAVVLVEFSFQVHKSLEKRTSRSKKKVLAFAEDLNRLPNLEELNVAAERWIVSGTLRHEEFLTCTEEPQDMLGMLRQLLDDRLAPLETQVRELRQKPFVPPVPKTRGALAAPGGLPKGSGGEPEGNALNRLREIVGDKPGMEEEPGRTGVTAANRYRGVGEMEIDPEEEASAGDLDSMMKVAMLKMLTTLNETPKKKCKHRRLPGLPLGDSEDSQEEDEDKWTSGARSGRGIEQVEKLKSAMKAHPQAYIDRMESKMAKAVNQTELDSTTPQKFGLTVPIGKSRTVGYCLQGFLEIHRNMVEGKPKLARLNTLRMISAVEQFVLDENWTVAARLTGSPEPPWGQWAVQDVGALRREYVYSRLAEPTWVGSLINELKEEDWLSKKRQNLKSAKGPGKGKEGAAASSTEG